MSRVIATSWVPINVVGGGGDEPIYRPGTDFNAFFDDFQSYPSVASLDNAVGGGVHKYLTAGSYPGNVFLNTTTPYGSYGQYLTFTYDAVNNAGPVLETLVSEVNDPSVNANINIITLIQRQHGPDAYEGKIIDWLEDGEVHRPLLHMSNSTNNPSCTSIGDTIRPQWNLDPVDLRIGQNLAASYHYQTAAVDDCWYRWTARLTGVTDFTSGLGRVEMWVTKLTPSLGTTLKIIDYDGSAAGCAAGAVDVPMTFRLSQIGGPSTFNWGDTGRTASRDIQEVRFWNPT